MLFSCWRQAGASGGFAQDGLGKRRSASATLSCQSSDGPDLHVSEAALCLSAPEKPGGGYRNRTGLHGFAIRCVTSPPTRQPSRWRRCRGTRHSAQGHATVWGRAAARPCGATDRGRSALCIRSIGPARAVTPARFPSNGRRTLRRTPAARSAPGQGSGRAHHACLHRCSRFPGSPCAA